MSTPFEQFNQHLKIIHYSRSFVRIVAVFNDAYLNCFSIFSIEIILTSAIIIMNIKPKLQFFKTPQAKKLTY